MFGIHHFGLFLTAWILLNLIPEPDTLYILGRSIAGGRRAGIASALGSIFHTCAAALGLSAFLATSAWALTAVKLAGGAYLVFLGVRALFQPQERLMVPSLFKLSHPGSARTKATLN